MRRSSNPILVDPKLDTSHATEQQLSLLGLEGVEKYLARIRRAVERHDHDAKRTAMERIQQVVQHLLLHLDAHLAAENLLRLDQLYRYLLLKLAHCHMFDDMASLSRCDLIIQDLRLEWALVHERAGMPRDQQQRSIDFDNILIG